MATLTCIALLLGQYGLSGELDQQGVAAIGSYPLVLALKLGVL
jgi:hypothetical protein